MRILAVDTAGKTASVALVQDGRLLYEVYFDGGLTHSETLLPMIDTCLKMCHLTCADIDLYGVNAGPAALPACGSVWLPSRVWPCPGRCPVHRCPPWKPWPPATPAAAPSCAPWTPGGGRCTAPPLTWKPTPA